MSLPQELAGASDTAPWTAVNANSIALGSAFHFAHDLDLDSALDVRITGGPLSESVTATDTDVSCTDDDDNYIVVAVATGVISGAITTTNWTSSSYARIGIATFASGVLTYTDARCWNGGVLTGATGSGSGTVTSVAASVPAFLSIAGSPVTTTGTLAISYSGTALPVANGGTGATALTANNVILGNGTSAVQFVAPGSSGNVLTSNGTTWQSTAPATDGTVTNTGGSLTSNAVVLGAGTNDSKVVAGITTDGTSAVNLGTAGATVGKVVLANATSGSITIQPVTGALGTVTLSAPATTGTLALTSQLASSDVKPIEHIAIACSDETTALTTGTAKVTFRMPYAFTLTAVRASVTTAPTGGTLLTVDINEAGSTILSTKLTFDASEKTTTTAATPAVISDTSLADDAEMTIDIDAVGSTIAGAGLKVYLIGART